MAEHRPENRGAPGDSCGDHDELVRTVEQQRRELELYRSELAQTNAGMFALHAEVERQRQRVAVLDEVSRTVSSFLRAHEVVKALVRLIERESVDTSVAVWVYAKGEQLRREPADAVPDEDVDQALKLRQPVVRPRRLVIPLAVGPNLLGALELCRNNDFGEDDLSFFTSVAARSAVALRNAGEYERERELAERLQRAMLPTLNVPDKLELCARYRPAATGIHVGGDWFDAFPRSDGTITLTVGDVTGHGLDAAVIMGKLQNALRAYAIEGHGPAPTLRLAHELLRGWGSPLFATAVVADLEPVSGRLRWASAGHLPMLLVDGEDDCFLERPTAPLLGFPFGLEISEHEVEISPGSSLVLYTDGLVERRAESIDTGMKRLADAVRAATGLATEEAGDMILANMLGGDDHDDDVCLLLCRWPGS